MTTRAEELAELYSRAMNGKPVDVFVYNEDGSLDSKTIGYKCKNLEDIFCIKGEKEMEVMEYGK